MSLSKSSPVSRKKSAARRDTFKKPSDKKQARKRKERELQPTKRVPKASKKVKGAQLEGNDIATTRKDNFRKTRSGRVVAHKKTRKVASTSSASVTLDAGPSRTALDDDRFLERLDRIDRRLERIEDVFVDRPLNRAEFAAEHSAPPSSAGACSMVHTQEFDSPKEGESLDKFTAALVPQPPQRPNTKGQSNESRQAPAPKPVDKLAAAVVPQPPQRPGTTSQSNESRPATAPKPIDKLAAAVVPQPPQRPGTTGQSNESKQAPDPQPFDEFADEIAEAFEPQPPQRPSTDDHSSESKLAPDPEPKDEFFDDFA